MDQISGDKLKELTNRVRKRCQKVKDAHGLTGQVLIHNLDHTISINKAAKR